MLRNKAGILKFYEASHVIIAASSVRFRSFTTKTPYSIHKHSCRLIYGCCGEMMSKSKRKPVLADHRKVGKDFLPPLLQLTRVQKIGWRDFMLPELIWLGLLNSEYGLRKGSELALMLAKTSQEVANQEGNTWYAPISAYASLSEDVVKGITDRLGESDSLDEIREGLSLLVALYPECPLSVFFDKAPHGIEADNEGSRSLLDEFKQFLSSFLNKYEKLGTLAQANAVYIAFVTEKLKVVRGVSGLEDFPLVADFPDTEASRRVAASIYPAINSLMGIDASEIAHTSWSRYFWNRGLELERCSINQVVNSYE